MLSIILAAALVTTPALNIDPRASEPLAPVASDHAPGSCHVRLAANGMQLPDPACSPGAINPTLTTDVLLNPAFRTGMVRDKLTSAAAKRKVYVWYGITPPKNNTGASQTCELDHVVDIGAGGADSLANIWPQCERPGAPPVAVGEREFKTKDRFAEHDVMRQIKAGGDLATLQRRIAEDWTLFIVSGAPPLPAAAPVDPYMARCLDDAQCHRSIADWTAKFCATDKATGLTVCNAPGH